MDRLVQYFRALSEEVRLRIIMLLTRGEFCVCDIMEILDEPQSKVSRHLSYLKSSGLISAKRVRVWMHTIGQFPLREGGTDRGVLLHVRVRVVCVDGGVHDNEDKA